jgi:hypothetical protein
MGTIKSAKEKRDYIWEMVNSQGICGLGYDEEKLISVFCMNNFSTRQTCKELLKEFEMNDKIIRKNGKVYSRLFFNPDLTLREDVFIPIEEDNLDDEIEKILKNEKNNVHNRIEKEVKKNDNVKE